MTTTVAQVGAFKPRSQGDFNRWMSALGWLATRGALRVHDVHDVINLQYGRDFLRERKRYDLVVVHAVFDGQHMTRAGFYRRYPKAIDLGLQVSPLNSEARWVKRLAATRAQYIFVFEDLPSCINGWGLGDLPGYKTEHRDTVFTVYRKVTR